MLKYIFKSDFLLQWSDDLLCPLLVARVAVGTHHHPPPTTNLLLRWRQYSVESVDTNSHHPAQEHYHHYHH